MKDVDWSGLGFTQVLPVLDGSVLVLTMNRDEQRNTFTWPLCQDLIRIFELADEDDRVRVVMLTARPEAPAFCAGADLEAGWSGVNGKGNPFEFSEPGTRLTLTILRCRKITISAVNGHAAGAGMTAMQLPYDFRFVWAGAKLVMPFVRRGIAAESLSSYLLPRLLGLARAKSVLLSGEVLSPSSSYLSGLYHDVLPTREAVFPRALGFAKELAANSSMPAVAYTKGLLLYPPGDGSPEAAMRVESMALSELSAKADATEAANAFLERRKADMKDVLGDVKSTWYPWWKVPPPMSKL